MLDLPENEPLAIPSAVHLSLSLPVCPLRESARARVRVRASKQDYSRQDKDQGKFAEAEEMHLEVLAVRNRVLGTECKVTKTVTLRS